MQEMLPARDHSTLPQILQMVHRAVQPPQTQAGKASHSIHWLVSDPKVISFIVKCLYFPINIKLRSFCIFI